MYQKVLYAAVGAPVVAAKKTQERLSGLRERIAKEAKSLRTDAETRVNAWAEEGEKVVSRITDGRMVDELTSRVDFEQAKEQVSKLRDQLEDMLSTWRSSFRPADKPVSKPAETTEVKAEAAKPAPKKAATRKPAPKPGTARKATAKPAAAKA